MTNALNAAAVVAAMAMPTVVSAAQQPPVHNMADMGQAASQAAVAECAQAQPRALQTIDVANLRLEAARQSNSPTAMRAAMDEFQAALGSLRAQLAACEALQATAPADPHAGHVMPAAPAPQTPNVAQAPAAAPGAAVMSPGSTSPAPAAVAPAASAPGGAADPHAGHVMPGAPQTAAPSRATSPAAAAQPRSAPPTPARQPGSAGNTTITFRSIPNPPRGAAENQFEVTVKDGQGKPVDGADVSLLFYMPAMPAMRMGEMRNEVKLTATGSGTYTGPGQIMMAGQWTVTVSVKQNGKEVGQQQVTVTAK